MKAKREQWQYSPNAKVWAGKYRNSHNMPHWHYDCELLFVENGSLDIFCNQKGYRVSKGRCHRDYLISKRDGIAEMLCRFSFVFYG